MRASPTLRPHADERSLRYDVEGLLLRSGAHVIELLHGIAGDDGLALGFAFRDIAPDREMTPAA